MQNEFKINGILLKDTLVAISIQPTNVGHKVHVVITGPTEVIDMIEKENSDF